MTITLVTIGLVVGAMALGLLWRFMPPDRTPVNEYDRRHLVERDG